MEKEYFYSNKVKKKNKNKTPEISENIHASIILPLNIKLNIYSYYKILIIKKTQKKQFLDLK
jgi:hypothetical protein